MLNITTPESTIRDISGLKKYTMYEFQVLAYTSVGDGPNESLEERTQEDGKILFFPVLFRIYSHALESLEN